MTRRWHWLAAESPCLFVPWYLTWLEAWPEIQDSRFKIQDSRFKAWTEIQTARSDLQGQSLVGALGIETAVVKVEVPLVRLWSLISLDVTIFLRVTPPVAMSLLLRFPSMGMDVLGHSKPYYSCRDYSVQCSLFLYDRDQIKRETSSTSKHRGDWNYSYDVEGVQPISRRNFSTKGTNKNHSCHIQAFISVVHSNKRPGEAARPLETTCNLPVRIKTCQTRLSSFN